MSRDWNRDEQGGQNNCPNGDVGQQANLVPFLGAAVFARICAYE